MLTPVCGNIPHPLGGLLKVVSAQVPGPETQGIRLGMSGRLSFLHRTLVSARTPPLLTPNWTIYFRTWLSRASSVQVLGCLYLVNVEHGGRSCVAPLSVMMGVRSSPHYPRIISPAEKKRGQRNADPSPVAAISKNIYVFVSLAT